MELNAKHTIPQLKSLVDEVNVDDTFLTMQSDEIVTLFVSFDIVNSTLYKSLHKKGWSTSISNILRHIISLFSNNPTGGYDFWKTLGDEIIYTRKIGTVQDLLDSLDEIYRSLIFLNQKIAQGELCDSESAKILSIKGTAWLADLSSSYEKTDNILTYYQINDKRRQADYIGPDIDTGFRTAQFSKSNRMIISFDIACILLRHQHQLRENNKVEPIDISQRIHLLAYRVLKGVWDGNPYPILVYHNNANMSFLDSLSPTEQKSPSVFQEYWDSHTIRGSNIDPKYHCYQEQELEQLCEKLHLGSKIERLMNLMEKTGRISTLDVKDLTLMDCTAVCYRLQDGEIEFLLMKDEKTDLWGFGKASFFFQGNFAAQTEKFYKEELGLGISIEKDKHYYTPIPLAVSISQFAEDNSSYTKHSVLLGRLDKNTSLEKLPPDKMKLLKEATIQNFSEKSIPLFKEILSKCASTIKRLELEKTAQFLPYSAGGDMLDA